jgi:hypothetical protein
LRESAALSDDQPGIARAPGCEAPTLAEESRRVGHRFETGQRGRKLAGVLGVEHDHRSQRHPPQVVDGGDAGQERVPDDLAGEWPQRACDLARASGEARQPSGAEPTRASGRAARVTPRADDGLKRGLRVVPLWYGAPL